MSEPSTSQRAGYFLVPRGPSIYGTLDTIQTTFADEAAEHLRSQIPPSAFERVAEVLREVVRHGYMDGLQDGFVQGVTERACLSAEEWRQARPLSASQEPADA